MRAQHDAEQKYQDTVTASAADDEAEPSSLYAEYKPKFIHEGAAHPASVVETASLARVQPPSLSRADGTSTYEHSIQHAVESGAISNLQLEAIVYASMRFERRLPSGERMGFFLGDGAGIGKVRACVVVGARWSHRGCFECKGQCTNHVTCESPPVLRSSRFPRKLKRFLCVGSQGRQIAGLIREQWRASNVRRVLWVSVSTDLKFDAARDMKDMDMNETHGEITLYPEGASLPKASLKLDRNKVQDGVVVRRSQGPPVRDPQRCSVSVGGEERRTNGNGSGDKLSKAVGWVGRTGRIHVMEG